MGTRRVQERRMTRAEREASTIEAALVVWNEKIAEQTARKTEIQESVTLLFSRMKRLDRVEVEPWRFENFMGLRFYRFVDGKVAIC
jgi:hypothetical protein